MARRRKKKRGFNPAPLILIALVLMAAVVWAIVPRKHASGSHSVSAVTEATAVPAASPPASPQATAAPSAAPSASAMPSPTMLPSGKGQLAIIIDDCGQWMPVERQLVALPIPLTMSVMPHVRYSTQISQLAADAGKGVMLHLPMEPLSHKRSGEGEIETAMTDAQIDAQTKDDLAQVPLAQGVNNHEGSAASADERVMKDVMNVVKAHNLFFIDSRTNKATVAASVATGDGVPNASRDVFLDNEANEAYSESMLLRAAQIAQSKGAAIAIGHPKPTTLEAIRALYPRLEAQGITFVLASTLVR